MWVDAVFEGGGVKGICMLGAADHVEQRGYRWKRLAGTSAGALIASLLAAGYTAKELKAIAYSLDVQEWRQLSKKEIFPLLQKGVRLFFGKGMFKGEQLRQRVGGLLEKKGIRTFADLPSGKLQIIASDITNGKMLILPRDIRRLGMQPEQLEVAEAVRMSCSFPFYFQPVVLRGPKGNKVYIVDGGLLSNFPIWIFDREEGTPRWPTFGFKVLSKNETVPRKIRGWGGYMNALFWTVLETHDTAYIAEKDLIRTIVIPPQTIHSMQFDLTEKQKQALFEAGRASAERFFHHWSFQTYVKRCRDDKGDALGKR